MIGTIRWNLIVGAVGFVLTFALSMGSNIWLTTLLRSCYSFATLFVVVFLFRWILGSFGGLIGLQDAGSSAPAAGEEPAKGQALDMLTPDDEEDLHRMLKNQPAPPAAEEDATFTPLDPPKLTTRTQLQADEMAQAVRRMSQE